MGRSRSGEEARRNESIRNCRPVPSVPVPIGDAKPTKSQPRMSRRGGSPRPSDGAALAECANPGQVQGADAPALWTTNAVEEQAEDMHGAREVETHKEIPGSGAGRQPQPSTGAGALPVPEARFVAQEPGTLVDRGGCAAKRGARERVPVVCGAEPAKASLRARASREPLAVR